MTGKRDHHEALASDYLVLRPGPNFHWLIGSLAAGQPAPPASEQDQPSDDHREAKTEASKFLAANLHR